MSFNIFFFCLFLGLAGCQSSKLKNEVIGVVTEDQKQIFRSNIFFRDLTDLNGKTIKLNELKAPLLIVNFWASWCRPCMEEMPSLLRLKKKFPKEELQVISINVDKENQFMNIKKVHNKLHITDEFISIADVQTEISRSVGFTTIPVSIFFHKGEVIQFQDGPMNFDSYYVIQMLKKLLE